MNQTFLYVARSAGLRLGPGLGGCRIQDLRHTFAVRSLEQCVGDRKSVARHMTALSTYLGHAHVSDTYWYLQATPKLLYDVAEAAEALYQGGLQ
jgi:integrase